MNTPGIQIKLAFSSPDRFCKYYGQLKRGIIFLPMRSPLPAKTRIMINLDIPDIEGSFSVIGEVVQVFDRHTKISGVKVKCIEGFEPVLLKIEAALSENEHYCRILGLEKKNADSFGDNRAGQGEAAHPPVSKSPDSGLSMEWIRDAVAEEEVVRHEEPPRVKEKIVHEKRELTEEERKAAEPVGYFIMNLTKAMLRSGYYDPAHPGAKDAKSGLYDEFLRVMGEKRELMVTNRETREHRDILLIGVLDEPVSVKTLVGAGVSGLFVPKLKEYCNRKELVSFTIKRNISRKHFEAFVDIMGDPYVEQRDSGTPGQYLTSALVENGITEISAVFIDDMIRFERSLPWRVEMAIQRLAKDLRVMPMFRGIDSAEFKKMKRDIVSDIIRPLKHPKYLNDFLVNAYIIAKHIREIESRDIEEMLVEAFPFNLLIPTVEYTFREFESLNAAHKKEPDNQAVSLRLLGIKRILKHIARRVLMEKSAAGFRFLDQLYQHDIMSFEELPKDVQQIIRTRIMADDIVINTQNYTQGIKNAKSPEDALVFLKCFRRAVPLLLERNAWDILLEIGRAVNKASSISTINTKTFSEGLKTEKGNVVLDPAAHEIFQKKAGIEERPVIYIFKEVTNELASAFRKHIASPVDLKSHAPIFTELITILGRLGIEVLSRVLAADIPPLVRKQAMSMMIQKKDAAAGWAREILSSTGMPVSLYLAAIEVLSKTGLDESDFEPVRPFLNHGNPVLKCAAIDAVPAFRPIDAEALLISALKDHDAKARWHALRAIDKFAPISEASMIDMLTMILEAPKHEEHGEKKAQVDRVVRLISAINGMWQIPIPARVESDVIAALEHYIPTGSIWKRKIGYVDEDANIVLKAAVPLLVRIGGKESKAFFKRLKYPGSPFSKLAQDALSKIKAAEK